MQKWQKYEPIIYNFSQDSTSWTLQIFWHQLDILTDILQKRLDVFVLQSNAKLNWKILHCTYMDMDVWGGIHKVIALCYLVFFEKAEKEIKYGTMNNEKRQ